MSWLLKDGMIYDGSGNAPYHGDVRIHGGIVTEIGLNLPVKNEAVIDVGNMIVTPGLIDMHVHVYDEMNLHSISPADAGLKTGVTTLLDMGSAGAMTYAVFEKYIISQAKENIYALLNVSHFGVQGHPDLPPYLGDLHDVRHLDIRPMLSCLRHNGGRIVGVKARLTSSLACGNVENQRVALQNVTAVSRQTGLPCYIHHVASDIPLEEVLGELRRGDVLTHLYHARGDGGFTGKDGAPSAAMLAARERGIYFDVGHGSGCFSWPLAERACTVHHFWPDVISSDIHKFNIESPVVDLPTTMTKFLHLGMPLEQVIQHTTARPAKIMGIADHTGLLAVGRAADISILRLDPGEHRLIDSEGETRIAKVRIMPLYVFRQGKRYECSVKYLAP